MPKTFSEILSFSKKINETDSRIEEKIKLIHKKTSEKINEIKEKCKVDIESLEENKLIEINGTYQNRFNKENKEYKNMIKSINWDNYMLEKGIDFDKFKAKKIYELESNEQEFVLDLFKIYSYNFNREFFDPNNFKSNYSGEQGLSFEKLYIKDGKFNGGPYFFHNFPNSSLKYKKDFYPIILQDNLRFLGIKGNKYIPEIDIRKDNTYIYENKMGDQFKYNIISINSSIIFYNDNPYNGIIYIDGKMVTNNNISDYYKCIESTHDTYYSFLTDKFEKDLRDGKIKTEFFKTFNLKFGI